MISHNDMKQAYEIESNGRDHFGKHWKGLFENLTFDVNCE